MTKIRPILLSFTLLLMISLAACSSQPEVLVVEITRVVPQIEEVEVTRLVEVEKEVTRMVDLSGENSSTSAIPGTGLDLETLQVDLWPDYDQASVLVLLSGRLPAALPLPASIAIPAPADAQINAVAQIGESSMTSIDYQSVDGAVIFQSPSPAFRVEYYVPYQLDQDRRTFDFQWLAPFSVYELALQVQHPANAVDLATQPDWSAVFTNPADGLDYYQLEPRSVPRGIPYNLTFSYSMTSDTLTVDELSPAAPESPDGPLHNNQQAASHQLAAK